ncbi:MAG: hypothetical protein ACLFU8_14860 [Anaerolineales bacterium]
MNVDDSVERLTAGLDEEELESLGDLEDLTRLLAGYDLPPEYEPGPREHARLLAALEPHLPAPSPVEERRGLRAWLNLVDSQAALLQPPFWWAGGLVLVLGLIVALLEGDGLLSLTFVLLTPVLAAAGVAYAFRPETCTLWELERLTPINPLELLYARLTLVLAFNALLSLVLLGVIWLRVPQVMLWRLLLAWLGPMLALTGLALYATVRWGPTVGAVLPLGLWGAFVLVGWWRAVERGIYLEGALSWLLALINASSLFPAVALLAAALGLLLLWQSGRLVEESA